MGNKELVDSIRLLRTPRPYPDESLKGLLLRATEANGYDNPASLLSLAGMRGYLSAKGFTMDWQALSKMLSIDASTLKVMSHCRRAQTPNRHTTYDFFGHVIPKYLLRATQPKICPACLRKSNYIRKTWDLSALTVCPAHKCFLVDECPACGKKISWDRSGVSVCKCKYNLRDIDLAEVEEPDIALSRQIYVLCNLDLGDDLPAHKTVTDDNPLYSLTMPELLVTMFFMSGQLGGMVDATGKFQAPRLENLQLHRDFARAFSIFDNWPDNYFKFLEKVKGSMPQSSGKTGIYKDFGRFYNSLYCEDNPTLLSFLRKGFEKYLTMLWDGGRTTQCSMLHKEALDKRKYLSRNEATEFLRVSNSWVDYFIESKMLRAVVKDTGKKRLILIETESVKELKDQFERGYLMTFRQVKNILGVGKKVVVGLILNGCLSSFRGPLIDGYPQWIFKKEAVDDLLKRIDESTRKLPVLCGGEIISFYRAIKKLSLLSIETDSFVKLILDGKIVPYGGEAQKGLSGLMFDNVDIMEYLRAQLKSRRKGSLTLEEAAKVIGAKYETLQLLIKKELITSEKISNGNYYYSVISQNEIKRFQSAYAMTGDIARRLGTSPRFLVEQLMTKGIAPVSGPKIDSGRQYFFKRSDIEELDIGELVSNTKSGVCG